jgi:hypothetical protein
VIGGAFGGPRLAVGIIWLAGNTFYGKGYL